MGENILWEIHEAEEWWDQKIGASNGDKNASKMDKYKANGALSDDETELLSDDGNDAGGVHGFTATHIANNVADDGELMKQGCVVYIWLFFFIFFCFLCVFTIRQCDNYFSNCLQ